MRETVGTVLIFVIAIASILALARWSNATSCEAKWKDSGRTSRYALFSGCQVEVRPGVWVPASAIREGDR